MQMPGLPQGQSHQYQSWLDVGPAQLDQNICETRETKSSDDVLHLEATSLHNLQAIEPHIP